MEKIKNIIITFIKYFLIFIFIYVLAFNTANYQNKISLITTIVLFILGFVFIIFFKRDNDDKYLSEKINIVSLSYIIFGMIGVASWGFLSTRDGVLTNTIYLFMIMQGIILLLIKLTIYKSKKTFLLLTYLTYLGWSTLFIWSYLTPTNLEIRQEFNKFNYSMKDLQTMIETFNVDNNNYPESYKQLINQAKDNKYYKEIKNIYYEYDNEPVITLSDIEDIQYQDKGKLIYYPTINKNNKITSYYIYAINNNGELLKHNGKIFTLSNN